jgi:hypothetical protein
MMSAEGAAQKQMNAFNMNIDNKTHMSVAPSALFVTTHPIPT